MGEIRLNILDQSPISAKENSQQALGNSLRLAKKAEELGYYAMLYSEHHAVKGYASSSPEIMAAHILANTKHIKVGTAGIMLRHYSALKVAEWTKMMNTLYPNRFILGLGRAPGGLRPAILALNNHKLPRLSDINQKLKDVLLLINEEETQYLSLKVQPDFIESLPQVYWLGSSIRSAKIAAQNGIGLSFFTFMEDMDMQFRKEYENNFKASPFLKAPHTQATIAVSVAGNLEIAKKNAYGMVYQFLESKKMAEPMPIENWQEIEKRVIHRKEQKLFENLLNFVVLGTPNTIGQKLKDLSEKYEVDELIILSNLNDFEDKIRNFEYIMEGVERI